MWNFFQSENEKKVRRHVAFAAAQRSRLDAQQSSKPHSRQAIFISQPDLYWD